jgi:hypothetical protein
LFKQENKETEKNMCLKNALAFYKISVEDEDAKNCDINNLTQMLEKYCPDGYIVFRDQTLSQVCNSEAKKTEKNSVNGSLYRLTPNIEIFAEKSGPVADAPNQVQLVLREMPSLCHIFVGSLPYDSIEDYFTMTLDVLTLEITITYGSRKPLKICSAEKKRS